MKEKPRAQRRAESAEKLLKAVKSIWNSLDKVPSFTGKARFMDKVKRAQTKAHVLADDLRWDASTK